MAGDEDDAVGVQPVRQRNPQRGYGGQSRGDAVDDLDFNSGGMQMLDFLAATAKNERIAALEPHDVFTFPRGDQHQFFDKSLRRGLAAAALADVNDARAGTGKRNDFVADQVVDKKHGGALDRLEGFEGEQFRIAGACAYEGDFAVVHNC